MVKHINLNLVDEIKELKLKKTYKHTIDILVDAIEVTQDERSRLQEAVELHLSMLVVCARLCR